MNCGIPKILRTYFPPGQPFVNDGQVRGLNNTPSPHPLHLKYELCFCHDSPWGLSPAYFFEYFTWCHNSGWPPSLYFFNITMRFMVTYSNKSFSPGSLSQCLLLQNPAEIYGKVEFASKNLINNFPLFLLNPVIYQVVGYVKCPRFTVYSDTQKGILKSCWQVDSRCCTVETNTTL